MGPSDAIPASPVRCVRIFISSPGDVDDERKIAERVISRLQGEYRGRAQLEPYFWEYEPMRLGRTFQDQIPATSEFDVVICILWSRLGTPLNAPDGKQYPSGTDYEVESAKASLAKQGRPDLMIYLNQTPAQIRQLPREERDRMIHQLEALEDFVRRNCFDPKSGAIKGAFHTYRDLGQFEDLLERHLHKLISEKAPAPAAMDVTEATWRGRPYQGLKAFDFEQAPIFFGRTRATGEVLALLRKRAALLEEARAAAIGAMAKEIDPAAAIFVLVCAMSGVGKSSLIRAGVLPLLIQPGSGIGLWRRVILKPSGAAGDLFDGLANELTKNEGLPELLSGGVTREELAFMLRQNPGGIELLLKQALSQAAEAARMAEDTRLREEEETSREQGRIHDVERFAQIRARLTTRPARIAVVIDQMEELFTLDRVTPELRRKFGQVLATLARSGWVWVIGTLRSDFFARCAEMPELMELKAHGFYDLKPPTPDEMGQMIRRPAEAAGLRFERHPTTEVALDEALRDAGMRHPEALPLLEFALDELYERRTAGGLLTWDAYEKIGRLEGALATAAEDALTSLEPWRQETFDHVMSGLVTLATDRVGVANRRTVDYDTLTQSADARVFVDRFIEARLFVADRDTEGKAIVCIAHEALLARRREIDETRQEDSPGGSDARAWLWARLGEWIERNADFLRMRARVAASLKQWQESGRDDGFLLHAGRPLLDGETLMSTHRQALSTDEQAYVIQSMRRNRQKVLRRRITTVALLLIFAALALWASLAARAAIARRLEVQRMFASSDFSRGQELFDAGEAPGGLVYLARAIDADPGGSRAAADRLWFALTQRDWPLPLTAVMSHSDAILSASFSPDGSKIVTTSRDTTARLWDSQSGHPVGKPMHHGKLVRCAVFSPDGLHVVTGCFDGTVRLWNVASGQPVAGWHSEHADSVNSVTISPHGRWVATGSRDGTVRIWDLESGKRLAELSHPENVHTLTFHPSDDSLLLTVSGSKWRLWRVPEGNSLFEGEHDGQVNSARFSPDGQKVITTGSDRKARLWNPSSELPTPPLEILHNEEVKDAFFNPHGDSIATVSGTEVFLWKTDGSLLVEHGLPHQNAVAIARFSPDGMRLLTGSAGGRLQVWSVPTGEPLGEPIREIGAVVAADFSPDGRRILIATAEGTARVWRSALFHPIALALQHGGAVEALAESPDGRHLAVASADGNARLWDLTQRPPAARVLPHPTAVLCVAFSFDGRYLATGAGDTIARIWPVASSEKPIALSHGAPVCAIAFSRDGKLLATASEAGVAQCWEVPNFQPLGKPMLHEDRITAISFSSDGRRLVTSSWDKTARVWNSGTGEPAGPPMAGEKEVTCAAFCPTADVIATGSRDGNAQLWDASTGKRLHDPLRHHGAVVALAFSVDGRRLATASQDGIAAIWDVATGQSVCDDLHHPAAVTAIAFSPDSARLATATEEGGSRIWDVASGQALSEWLRSSQPVRSLLFSADGRTLFTGSADRTVRMWDIATPRESPHQMADFGRALSSSHLQQSGRLEPRVVGPFEELRTESQKLGLGTKGPLATWFFADPLQRSLTPFASLTVPAFLESRIQEGTPASLEEAELLAAGDAEVLNRIEARRKKLSSP